MSEVTISRMRNPKASWIIMIMMLGLGSGWLGPVVAGMSFSVVADVARALARSATATGSCI